MKWNLSDLMSSLYLVRQKIYYVNIYYYIIQNVKKKSKSLKCSKENNFAK